MATTLKLYYTISTALGAKWELIPSKLLVVEDIESYLAGKTAKTITDFQYIKNELELSINVDISQSYSQPRSETNFKYASIQNSGEQIHYYFVKKTTWRSKSCVRFELVMDVLNTFQEGRDFNFKANTRIVREHKNRFVKTWKTRYIHIINPDYNIVSGEFPQVDDEVILYPDGDLSNQFVRGDVASITFNEDDPSLVEEIVIEINDSLSKSNEEIIAIIEQVIADDIAIIWQDIDLINEVDLVITEIAQINFSYTGTEYLRNIDYVSEGINPVLQCGNASGEAIEDKSVLDQDWYILYRNQNNPTDSLVNPVECYIIPENETKTNSAYIENGRLIPSFLEDNKWYFFRIRSAELYTLSNGVVVQDDGVAGHIFYLMLTKAGNKIMAQGFKTINTHDQEYMEILWEYDDITYITITGLPAYYNVVNTSPNINFNYLRSMSFPNTFNNSGTENTLDPITELDRTDAKNIKLIKLPYCPYHFNVSGTTLQTNGDSNWDYASLTQASGGVINVLKLKNMHLKLTNTLSHTSNNPLKDLLDNSIIPNINSLRETYHVESKLFHSDFYQPTYYYDSFTYKVQLEKLNINSYIPLNKLNSLTIIFDMTSTINSRFMFTFDNLSFRYATENYAKYMPLARNNEEVLYNVPYINYIRTGFNYDVKSKERASVSNIAGIALSGASTIASLAFPSAPLKIAGVVAGLVSMAMSIKNTVVNTIQNEESIQKKIQEAQNQSSSVAGSDDVDLMSIYAENRLKYLVYQPSPIMKQVLFDLFFYAGYNSGRMAIPTHNNRVNFDYLECEASLENEGSIPDDCLQELLNCFRTGITYLHKTTRTTDKWDFEQKYENWENDLLED